MSAIDPSELDGYEALVSELRANPPVAPERLRHRVLEGASGRRRRTSGRRRLTLVVVPVAVALAVGAALVHGFVRSGSHGQAAKATSLGLLGPSSRPARALHHPATKANRKLYQAQSATTVANGAV